MKIMVQAVLASVFALASVTALADAGEFRKNFDAQATIAVRGAPVYPEGIAFDPVGNRFIVGSARLGHLYAVGLNGELRQFSSDERIATILGVKVDAPRNRVVAAVADYGVGLRSDPARRNNLAAVAVFELATGRTLALHDLTDLVPGPAHLANDVAIDQAGNIYVTDSLAAAIYRIDAAGQRSVFLQSERFRGDGFRLNGLDVHPDGYLLVVQKADGRLFRVPLNSPQDFVEVTLPEPMTAGDGILLVERDLLVIRNRTATVAANEIVVLRSSDGWRTATIASRTPHEDSYPATATRRGNQIMTATTSLHLLGTLLRDTPNQLQQEFQIRQLGTIEKAN
jgi:sugar lactone lactonase YvrE